jgi:hypothetical protein
MAVTSASRSASALARSPQNQCGKDADDADDDQHLDERERIPPGLMMRK